MSRERLDEIERGMEPAMHSALGEYAPKTEMDELLAIARAALSAQEAAERECGKWRERADAAVGAGTALGGQVAALRSENAGLREALEEVRAWRLAGVGLGPVPTTDAATLGARIEAALASPAPAVSEAEREDRAPVRQEHRDAADELVRGWYPAAQELAPYIAQALADAAAEERERCAKEWMPIQDSPLAVRMDVLSEKQAQRNHSQSLETLRQRHGISLCEAAALLEERKWKRMSGGEVLAAIREASRD